MEFPEAMALRHPILIRDLGGESALPDWARAEIWLGWWCRRLQLAERRLLVVAVVPSRELAAAFAGLGCLLAGAQLFRDGFTWSDFRNLPLGTEVFWRTASDRSKYGGVVLDSPVISDVVAVKIATSRRQRDIGVIWYFTEQKFAECLFSEESLPNARRSAAMENTMRLHHDLGLETNPLWIWTAGPEARIVTNQTKFWNDLKDMHIRTKDSDSLPFVDTLCAAKGTDKTLAKLRIASAGYAPDQNVPVTILDGDNACDRILQFESGNVLMLLDHAEYSADIRNYLLEARNVEEDPPAEALADMPARLPPGIEVAAFVFQAGR